MTLPKTYKRAAFTEAGGNLRLEDVPLQPPGKNEVLVKVEACGVCHSDKLPQNNAFGVGFPLVPGHEVIGRVAAVGEDVVAWKVGDRIGAGWHGGHDGTCGSCKKGLFQMCDNQAIHGVTKDGGYAEYVIVRSESGVQVPDDVDAAKYAPILCAGVTVFNGMRHMNVGPGETAAVQGLGGLGHLAIQYAKKFGYRVVAISRGTEKEEFARRLGAHEYIDTNKVDAGQALRELGGAALVVTTSPDPEGISKLVKGLAPMGKLLILPIVGDITFDTITMVNRGLAVHAWPTGHATDMEETIKFTQLQGVDCMIQKFPLAKANEAFDAMNSGSVRFRAVITME
ncbi:chaperonin 10-like protein [Chaetomium strumarium]|uniref:Chaperonin 10-like protein n=1 Tax=Chaetomium strumarium TaxID=1170767 RepID=A0AAJ0LXX8_9PEZI|nr:chaperonin 10-like protein [Chaetomium strumarium]